MNSENSGRKPVCELALTIGQRRFLNLDQHAEATPISRLSLILQFAYKISPSIDIRKLQRAVERLCRRHDSLRVSFEPQGNSWRATIWDRPRETVEIHECAAMGEGEREALLHSVTNRTMDFAKDDLSQFVVFRGFGDADILLIRMHHIIADGYSMLLLAEDLIKYMIGIPVLGEAMSLETYVRQNQTVSTSKRLADEAYWQDLVFPALPKPSTSTFSTGVPTPIRIYTSENFRSLRRRIDRKAYDELPARFGLAGITSFNLTMACFAESLLELSGLPGVYLITYVDRLTGELKNYGGHAVQMMPIRCERTPGESSGQFATKLADQIRTSIQHLPTEAGSPLLSYDLAVWKEGGALCHIHCAEIFQSQRAKASIFGSNMETPIGTPRRVGPLTMTQLPVEQEGYSANGLNLRIRRDSSHANLEMSFYEHLFPAENIERLFDLTISKMGI